jgi:hypothetical protein
MSNHLNDEQLIGYVHYTLTDAERETMDEHMQVCVDCRARLAECEALQRRIRYSLSADIRAVPVPSTMTFGAIAPRLQRYRWRDRFRMPSGELLPGVTALAALVGLAVALVGLCQSLSWSRSDAETIQSNPLMVLACGFFAVTLMGNYGWKSLPSRQAGRGQSRRAGWVQPLRMILPKVLAFVLWIGTAIVGLQVIVVILDLLLWLSSRGFSVNVAVISIWPLGIAWIALVVGGGEYHYERVGQRSSWRLFGWTVVIELLMLVLPYILESAFAFPRFLS